MRILHTSDWHVGKKLGRYDRRSEYDAVLSEVVEIADREAVDLVVVSGDLFDRPSPPLWALSLVIERLQALAVGRPVVAVAGNHDSGELFEVLAPLLAPNGVHLVGTIKRPDEGGVLTFDTAAGRAAIACFPFLREGHIVDFMASTERWYGLYADRIRDLAKAYADAAVTAAGADGIAMLAAHFMVTGASLGGHGVPRGERQLHIGKAYSATEQAIPPSLAYVAMGHIHAPQRVPHAAIPAEYAGSLLELDFGEAGEQKRVVVVDSGAGATRPGAFRGYHRRPSPRPSNRSVGRAGRPGRPAGHLRGSAGGDLGARARVGGHGTPDLPLPGAGRSGLPAGRKHL